MPTGRSIKLFRQQAENRKHATTGFDTAIADRSTSLLDLPSTYPFNSERYALIQEGTVDDTDFIDSPGEFGLSVNGTEGDVHELRARQRVTYLPNFEILIGSAFYMQESLEPGQLLTLKFANPTGDNGYITEITHDSRRSYIKNGGTEVNPKQWGTDNSIDPYAREELDETNTQVLRSYINWYGDGRVKNTLSYADDKAEMSNPTVSRCANRGEVATEEINLNISVRLECTEATTANTVNVLSCGALTRGDNSKTNRVKPGHNWGLGGGIGPEDFTIVLASRRIPEKKQIPTQLDNMEIIPSDTMEVIAVAFPDDTTDATGWDTPPQQNSENTAVESTTNVSTFPTDADGNPDGRLLDMVIADAQGNRSERSERTVQSEFYENEILGFLARTKSASNASVDLTRRMREEW